jgi:hypothetical protein
LAFAKLSKTYSRPEWAADAIARNPGLR